VRYAVLLAGGSGERLWPMSRTGRPKQLVRLIADRTLVAETLHRIVPLVDVGRSIVMTSAALRQRVLAELPAVPPDRIVGEPIGRNTAPAIALGAHVLLREDPDATLAVLPADHVIADPGAFRRAMTVAFDAAESARALVTLGVRPTRPETEYGYIRAGGATAIEGAFAVSRFEEKPDRARAESFLAEGGHYWNSGMFVWRADRFLEDVDTHLPEVARALERVTAVPGDGAFGRQIAEFYERVPSVSVDYGVMERASGVVVVPADFGWDDVGTWTALKRVWGSDGRGNTLRGEVVAVDSEDCIVYSEGGTVAVLGLSGVVVAHTPAGTLVCPAERARDVRLIVEELGRRRGTEDR
jgi:mannose-1-phosphate guanylyltransferase/mannose-6-phosphate isomerase